jgi:RNA polymerase sigma-70 factor (ECF subfamily)
MVRNVASRGGGVSELEARRARYASDLALARRCVDDDGARQQVFREHADAVFRLAWRLVSNRADAEDVVQEVFIQVFGSIHSFRGEASLRSWLHRVTVRTAGRYRRRVRRQRDQLELVVEGMERPLAGGGLSQVLESREALRRLWQLLERVVDRRRVVFVLHEVEGYTLPEAAALLDISVTAAKKRVWRARRDLAKLASGDPVLGVLFEQERDKS